MVPYYNKPSQEGIYRHFRAVAEAVDLPVVLYNVPGRTVADMQHDTVIRLAQVPGIVGIKEATGNIERAAWLIKHAPKGFSIYSGDDGTAVALMLLGGHGNVSVTANVAPKLMHEMCIAAIEGDVRRATAIHLRLLSLHRQLFCGIEPRAHQVGHGPSGLCQPHVRLPILPLTEAARPWSATRCATAACWPDPDCLAARFAAAPIAPPRLPCMSAANNGKRRPRT